MVLVISPGSFPVVSRVGTSITSLNDPSIYLARSTFDFPLLYSETSFRLLFVDSLMALMQSAISSRFSSDIISAPDIKSDKSVVESSATPLVAFTLPESVSLRSFKAFVTFFAFVFVGNLVT